MPKFKVVNPDAPEEIDFYQDIPLVDPDTGADQLDSEGNILVKRYVNHTVSIKGINEVKDALPAIKTNTQNLEELYQYSHAQNEAQQIAINNNASAIVDLQTSTSEMALDLETLTNKVNGIQGIDIDALKDYVYTQVPLIKNSYLPLVGGTITGNVTVEEGTITGSLTGVASFATADINNKDLTSYVADIMGANAQLSIIKGDGTTSVLSINNVLKATNADSLGGYPASDYIRRENFGGGLEVGDIALAPLGIDETDNCRRYLNGQVILQSQFSKFTEKLKHAITLYPNLATTEQNWQSAVTLSPLGQCGKFVIDDEAGTIRLPKVVNVMGALDLSTIGQTVEAGLPNITGRHRNYVVSDTTSNEPASEGALEVDISPNKIFGSSSSIGATYGFNFEINASNANAIYGNSETVQQESIKYPYFIQVATSNSENVQIDTQVRLNNPFSLFMPYWSPIELNNLSWLRSNKQWNNGAVYVSAYEFLLEKYNSGTEQTETIAGVSVTYKLADNGMKIITDKNVYDALISASGSAWFFVLDTENTQFILPYTNGFAQCGGELGKFTEAGLPNITGGFGANIFGTTYGAFDFTGTSVGTSSGSNKEQGPATFNASRSSPIYGKSPTVQPNSVTGYLYFYVGEVEQDANIIATSGLAESISRKLDIEGASRVGMHSDRFVELSVGASESLYTAPADGFFYCEGSNTVAYGNISIINNNTKIADMRQPTVDAPVSCSVIIPVRKGDMVKLYYHGFSIGAFKFIYAEGAK